MTFTPYPKTERLKRMFCTITEKIDGTNAQLTVQDGEIISVGSRKREIFPGKATDNYGFAGWVERNTEELLKLGDGLHYGEWYGNGIQSGYGMSEKRFALFNPLRYAKARDARLEGAENAFPDCVHLVPVLYVGQFSLEAVEKCMTDLREHGSRVGVAAKSEGIIIDIMGTRYKETFEHSNGKWDKA